MRWASRAIFDGAMPCSTEDSTQYDLSKKKAKNRRPLQFIKLIFLRNAV